MPPRHRRPVGDVARRARSPARRTSSSTSTSAAASSGQRTIDRFWADARFDAPTRRRPGRLVGAVLQPHLGLGRHRPGAGLRQHPGVGRRGGGAHGRPGPTTSWSSASTRPRSSCPASRPESRSGSSWPSGSRTCPPNVRVVAADDPQSSYPLMEAADLGLVFSSTTGVELALAGTPVVVAGQSHYRDKGFTLDVSTPEEFASRGRPRPRRPRCVCPRPGAGAALRLPVLLPGPCRQPRRGGARPGPGSHHRRRPRPAGPRCRPRPSTASATASSGSAPSPRPPGERRRPGPRLWSSTTAPAWAHGHLGRSLALVQAWVRSGGDAVVADGAALPTAWSAR